MRALAAAALAYVRDELTQQLDDEVLGVLPFLRKRCRADNDITELAKTISQRAAATRALAVDLIACLQRLVRTDSLSHDGDALDVIHAFTAAERRHLSWASAVLIPLARRVLTAADLEDLGRDMAARRGVSYPD